MTPYADPEQQRQWQRDHYRRRYQDDSKFREFEAERKKPWYQKHKERISGEKGNRGRRLKLVVELFEGGYGLEQFATLRTWLRWCSQRKIPALKRQGQWYTSIEAINWYIWKCGNEAFRKLYRAPRKPWFAREAEN
jgi:hypothetical protein